MKRAAGKKFDKYEFEHTLHNFQHSILGYRFEGLQIVNINMTL